MGNDFIIYFGDLNDVFLFMESYRKPWSEDENRFCSYHVNGLDLEYLGDKFPSSAAVRDDRSFT